MNAATSPNEPVESGDGLRIGRGLMIPEHELVWRYSASGGPGGQHANTANTRVELVWDIATASMPEPLRERLIGALGPVVRVVVTEERSQYRNRSLARERLRSKVAAALVVAPARRASRPSRGAVERRLASKSRRAGLKADRRWRPSE
jgi:ribosome-associated protein